ncbi:MAG TPA: hypothetical protein VHM88_01190, partial [Candidatus Acidoferrales bacterium]|nr:hypothetical protein [Candidatus Acidoferrales bacterium]
LHGSAVRMLYGRPQRHDYYFKRHVPHTLLMLGGLHEGLEKLSPAELAEFFNEYCPCSDAHSQENLVMTRWRVQKDFGFKPSVVEAPAPGIAPKSCGATAPSRKPKKEA